MCWASPPHRLGEVYVFRVLKCQKTEHGTWGKEGHGGEDSRLSLRSDVVKLCIWMHTGAVEKEGAERGTWRNRMWGRE